MSFVGIRIKIHHVAGFLRSLRASVHGHRDIRLSEGGRVIRSIAGHCNQAAFGLLFPNQLQLTLRGCLREVIVDARPQRR